MNSFTYSLFVFIGFVIISTIIKSVCTLAATKSKLNSLPATNTKNNTSFVSTNSTIVLYRIDSHSLSKYSSLFCSNKGILQILYIPCLQAQALHTWQQHKNKLNLKRGIRCGCRSETVAAK